MTTGYIPWLRVASLTAFLLPCFIASQGKYEEAEPQYKQALAIDERLRGPDTPEVAPDLYNWAWLLEMQVGVESSSI